MTESTQTSGDVEMTHPASKQKITVAPEHLDRYRSQGWSEATAGAPTAKAGLPKWQEFARSKGFSEEDIAGKTRDDLRAALA